MSPQACRAGGVRPQVARIIVTPSGLESASSSAKYCEYPELPTGRLLPPSARRHLGKRECTKVAKLAILAGNAVQNADLHGASELIEEIKAVCLDADMVRAQLLTQPEELRDARQVRGQGQPVRAAGRVQSSHAPSAPRPRSPPTTNKAG